jgi:hypothetical protein
MKKILTIITILIVITSCQKSIPQPTPNYLYLKVETYQTLRFTNVIKNFHVVVFSDSTFNHQVIPPSPIYIEVDIDGNIDNLILTNSDTKILGIESVLIKRVLYEDKNTIIKF